MIIPKHREVLDNLTNPLKRNIVLQGGTRSGKTYSTLLYLSALCVQLPSLYVSAISVNAPHLRRGIKKDITEIVALYNLPARCLEYGVVFDNGSRIMYEHYDDEFKARGAGRDIAFLNEANLIDEATFRAIDTRTKYKVVIDYNPVAPFWAHDLLIDREDTVLGISTYLDNPYLSKSQIEAIEANKDNVQWWRVYGEGKLGEYSNQILRNWQQGEYHNIGREVIGLDFGFTNSPTACCICSIDEAGRRLHAKELLYKTGLTNGDIAELLKEYRHLPIIADSAEPKSIEEIRRQGFNIKPANKDVLLGISEVNRYVKVLQGANLVNEANKYVWLTDSNGQLTNAINKKFDHLIDAMRYAVATRVSQGWSLN